MSSIAMCFWAYGFLMANSAPDAETCLLWRRFSAIGWTTTFASLLHVIIILTGRDKNVKKLWQILLYLPAAINLYVFSLSDRFAVKEYELVCGKYGWVNLSVNTAWDWFFYVYYISYIIIALCILFKWKKETEDKAKKNQASVIIYSIILMGVLGSISDLVLNVFFVNPIPQMGPFFNLIPVISILYSAKNHNFMKEIAEGRKGIILTPTTRIKLYFYISFLYLTAGIITTFIYFLPRYALTSKSLHTTTSLALLFYLTGIIIICIQFIKKEKVRDVLVTLIILCSIPPANFMFIEYGAVTVWVFPIILMILSLVFNTQKVLLLITLVSVLTQFFLFLNVKTNIIHMDRFDYFFRICVFLIAYGIGTIINKLYVNRIKEIEYMGYYDHLTGLANRTLFTDRLNQAIEIAKRNKKFLAVIFMDLDGFKMINDSMGHSGGDAILKIVADSLTKSLRSTDTVARFGGDEFLILINDIEDANNIKKIADKTMSVFNEPLTIGSNEFYVTGSAGVAVYPIDGEDTESLVKNADIAMYKAKARGKNKYVLCTENMKEEIKKNMVLSNHLFRAIEKNELSVYYQPQISFKTGKIIGVEALLRWNHSDFGQVSPATFIPLSEKNGAINKIGEWVLRTACAQNKKWQEEGLIQARIGVNLSVIQFNDPLIVEKIEKIVEDTGLKAEDLDLEITESVAVKQNASVVEILNRLKELGVSLSIDDFGMEYSSLSRLKSLPIDRIKIDMQFVQGLEACAKDQAITKTIINLAKSLELGVIAEGVETKAQIDFLVQGDCDEAQGYYYYKPMPAHELENLLKEKHEKI